jgi:hypothetical protein
VHYLVIGQITYTNSYDNGKNVTELAFLVLHLPNFCVLDRKSLEKVMGQSQKVDPNDTDSSNSRGYHRRVPTKFQTISQTNRLGEIL